MFVTEAYAAGAAAPSADMIGQFVPLIVIFVLFFFMIIRPQMKRAKETRAMLAALGKGDEVVTTGGLVGRVAKVEEEIVLVEIAAGVEVRVQKSAVTQVLPKNAGKDAGKKAAGKAA